MNPKKIDSWRPNGEKQQQIRDSETHQRKKKKFRDSAKFSETHIFRGTILCA